MGTIKTILLLVRRSLRQHALSTVVTAISVALGAGLVMAVFAIQQQSERAFTGGAVGFDGIVGARGSPLQLVLNTVFHLETSPGNIPWSVYTELKSDPKVELAIPYAVGDNWYGYRIVGTTNELFTDFEYVKGKRFDIPPPGRRFHENRREAVIGAAVSRETGLKPGSTFKPYHGLYFDPDQKHNEEYIVVGVMAPTHSPSDRVIWIPIEAVFRMEGHVLRGTGEAYVAEAGVPLADEHKEVSAVMLKLRGGPMTAFSFDDRINKRGKQYTFVGHIASVIADLFSKLGWMSAVLGLVAILVCAVAAGAILASIYNTMNERRREFAILRALGATRGTVFATVTLEGGAIGLVGGIAGLAVFAAIAAAAASVIQSQTGVALDVWVWHPALAIVPVASVAMGAMAGMVPAFRAYRTDVAENLVPSA